MIEGPITEAQDGLWLARRLDPASPAQNTGQVLRLRGDLDAARLVERIDATLAECDALRVRIEPAERGSRQGAWSRAGSPSGAGSHFGAGVDVVASAGHLVTVAVPSIATRVVDLRGAPDALAAARAAIDDDMDAPRDPARDPMATSVLYRLGERDHLWYLCVQHLVIDGYGTTLLIERVVDRIDALMTGEAERTQPFRSFADVVAEDRAARVGPRREAERGFWHAELDGLGLVGSLSEGEPIAGPDCRKLRTPVPDEVRRGLERLARAARTGWPDAVIATAALYLARHTGRDEIVLGVPVMNRLGSASARVPCMRMNVLPLRLKVDPTATVVEWVAHVAGVHRRCRRHGTIRGEDLRRELGLLGRGRRLHGPVVNVLPFPPLKGPTGLDTDFEVLGAGPIDDLTFTLRRHSVDDAFDLEVETNPALYDEVETREHLDRFLAMLTAVAVSDETRLEDVPTLTPAERRRWVDEVNATDHPVPDTTLTALLAEAWAAEPDPMALIHEGGRWSRRELESRVRAMAARLEVAGVGVGSIVGVLLPRSAEQMVAILATIWRGAAYLPLDPDHPEARLRSVIVDAAPAVVVTDAPGAARVDEVPTLRVDEVPTLRVDEAAAGTPPRGEAGPDALLPPPDTPAYVIYTSGSTGVPNGVVVEHRAIVNRLLWMREAFGFGPGDVVLHKTPTTFDVSVWEIFLAHLSGAALVVAPAEAHRDPGWLARVVREQGVTAMHFVPSMLAPFLDHPDSEGLGIHRVFCSGEALPATLRDRFHARIRGELHNLYGPTEAAVDVTHWAAPPDDTSDPLPIGRPVWNTRTYVLDRSLRPVPPESIGELYLAGRQLARGYLARDGLTRERFPADPFRSGERMYRTGDLARWRRDGQIVYCGRVDHQVKVRGQRVELGEIETVLLEQAGVQHAVAGTRPDASGEPALVAWLVASEGAELVVDTLREALAERLPGAMIPSAWVVLDALPLTSSGKTDRRALPDPAAAAPTSTAPPATASEQVIAELYRDVLGLATRPGRDDDFFALGGHSLRAVELLRRLREQRGIDLGPGAVFAHPGVAALARVLDDALAMAGSAAAPEGFETFLALGRPPESPLPRLYCVHPAGGLAWCYRPLADALEGAAEVIGLQAAVLREGEAEPAGLDEMAAAYVDGILEREGRRSQRVGAEASPIHLLGWSVGGILAHAMACRLQALGRSPGLVVLLDAYPADWWHDEPEPDEGAALKALLLIAGVPPEAIDATPPTRVAVRAVLRTRGHVLGTLSDASLDGVIRAVTSTNRLVRRYRHRRLLGEVVHVQAALDHQDDGMDASLWAPHVDRVEAHALPTVHGRMAGAEASGRVAALLSARLRPEVPA